MMKSSEFCLVLENLKWDAFVVLFHAPHTIHVEDNRATQETTAGIIAQRFDETSTADCYPITTIQHVKAMDMNN